MPKTLVIPLGELIPKMCYVDGDTTTNCPTRRGNFWGGYRATHCNQYVALLCENMWSDQAAALSSEWSRAKKVC